MIPCSVARPQLETERFFEKINCDGGGRIMIMQKLRGQVDSILPFFIQVVTFLRTKCYALENKNCQKISNDFFNLTS